MTLEMTPAHRSAGEVLSWSRAMIEPALRAAVHRLPKAMLRLAGYHFGWWDRDGNSCQAPAGKAIRPALTLLCAQAVGGSPADAVGAAVAVELVHNFSLVHDDIMDGDEFRRHRPTMWHAFGVNQALLGGDAMLVAAFQALSAPAAAVEVLTRCVSELCEGQHADLSFEHRSDVDVDDYLAMTRGKTGSLMAASCELGALLGGAPRPAQDSLRRFGSHLGLAFQLVDDLLGIWGDAAVTGKPAGADLVRRKQSYPVVNALRSPVPAAAELAELYALPGEFVPEQVNRAALLVERAGGRAATQRHAQEQLSVALAALDEIDPSPRAKAELLALADLVTRRNS